MTEQERDLFLFSLKEHAKRTDKTLEELKDHAKKTDKILASMQVRIENLEQEVRSISASVAVIEKEHGDKLQALLDIVTGTIAKNYISKEDLESNKRELENHDIRICNLEQKLGIVS